MESRLVLCLVGGAALAAGILDFPGASAQSLAAVGPFDGAYSGAGTLTGAKTRGRAGMMIGGCSTRTAVTMRVASSGVTILSAAPTGTRFQYVGSVDANGTVSASHTFPNGRINTASGTIQQGRFSGKIQNYICYFDVEMTKG